MVLSQLQGLEAVGERQAIPRPLAPLTLWTEEGRSQLRALLFQNPAPLTAQQLGPYERAGGRRAAVLQSGSQSSA